MGRNYGQTDKKTNRQTDGRTIQLLDAPAGLSGRGHKFIVEQLIFCFETSQLQLGQKKSLLDMSRRGSRGGIGGSRPPPFGFSKYTSQQHLRVIRRYFCMHISKISSSLHSHVIISNLKYYKTRILSAQFILALLAHSFNCAKIS